MKVGTRRTRGDRIAFFDSRGRVVTVRPDGTARTVLGLAREFAWSPDGAELALVQRTYTSFGRSSRPESSVVELVAADGSTRRVLAHSDGRETYWSPSWIPKTTTLAIRVDDEYEDTSWRRVVDVRSGAVSTAEAIPSDDIVWSHDGSRLAVSTYRAVTVVSKDGSSRRVVWRSEDARSPEWSPATTGG
jgi:Tol biopolymer transport system component